MSKRINLSEAVKIAIHSMVLMAREQGVQINVKKISKLIGSSENHISKVMQRLTKGGFIYSTRGPSGGFVLGKPPKEISLHDIYLEIDGPIDQNGCPLNHNKCMFTRCLFGNKLDDFTSDMREYLMSKTLSDFI